MSDKPMMETVADAARASQAGSGGANVVLKVDDLRTVFRSEEGVLPAVDGVSFELKRGETLGIVGESGCGKSMTSLSIMRLLPSGAEIDRGRIAFDGVDLLALDDKAMRNTRGAQISMVFQEPMTSLNPVLTIGEQIAETVTLHQGVGYRRALERAEEMLRLVGIPEPRQRLSEYPHQLSGGMRQRVMIAIALSCDPQILIADEPTTALDVTIQAQILELMVELKQRLDTAIILITHDLGVIAELAERVLVMYAGRIVEEGKTAEIFDKPHHPYTRGLLQAIPRLIKEPPEEREPLAEIPGVVPALWDMPDGCRFAPRCPLATQRCRDAYPELSPISPSHRSACWESSSLSASENGAAR